MKKIKYFKLGNIKLNLSDFKKFKNLKKVIIKIK